MCPATVWIFSGLRSCRKNAQFWLQSSFFHEHGSSSGALGFHGSGSEASGVSSPKIRGLRNVWFSANNTILFGIQGTKWLYFLKIRGAWLLWRPLATPMSGAVFFHGSGFCSFSRINIFIDLVCLKMNGNESNQVHKTKRMHQTLLSNFI